MAETILVVEDDPALLGMVTEALDSEGYEVFGTTGFDRDAVVQVEAHHPAVVVLDYELPGLTGVEVAREIEAQRQRENIRLVAMTAAGRVSWVCEQMHADGCISKPFNLDDLFDAVGDTGHHGHTPSETR